MSTPVENTAAMLYAAAKVLDDRAHAATGGPWHASPVRSPDAHNTSGVYSFAHPTGTARSEVIASRAVRHYGPVIRPDDAAYVELVDPEMGKKIAEWLRLEASRSAARGNSPEGHTFFAFAIATMILDKAGVTVPEKAPVVPARDPREDDESPYHFGEMERRPSS